MEFVLIVLVMATTFFLCWGLDRGFTQMFRSKKQHRSGLSVRPSKHYGSVGLVLAVIGLAGILNGLSTGLVMLIGGALVFLLGAGLVTYYLSYGIYYDEESFLVTAFGKKSISYSYREIQTQQVYLIQGNNIMVELYLTDGKAVQVQLRMQGAEDFLNKAHLGWCRQKGLETRDCSFFDPQNSCWFPPVEER